MICECKNCVQEKPKKLSGDPVNERKEQSLLKSLRCIGSHKLGYTCAACSKEPSRVEEKIEKILHLWDESYTVKRISDELRELVEIARENP